MKLFYTLLVVLIGCIPLSAQKISDVMRPKSPALISSPNLTRKAKAQQEKQRKQKLLYVVDTTTAQITTSVALETQYLNNIISMSCPLVRSYEGQSFCLEEPTIRVFNSTLGREKLKNNNVAEFNASKDLLTDIVLIDNEFYIYNKQRIPCLMRDFEFIPNDSTVQMEENRLTLRHSAIDYAQGKLPFRTTVWARHIPSGAKAKIRLVIAFPDAYECHSEHNTLVLAPLPNHVKNDYACLFDMNRQTVRVVHLPVSIDAQGQEGEAGRNGSPGLIGMPRTEWKDKDGVVHVNPGTCGTAGGNGGDGYDGGDGGVILLCCSSVLYAQYGVDMYNIDVSAGAGGAGGRGGVGGAHGFNAPCYGYHAPNGLPGNPGKDGEEGEYLAIIADTYLLEQANLERTQP